MFSIIKYEILVILQLERRLGIITILQSIVVTRRVTFLTEDGEGVGEEDEEVVGAVGGEDGPRVCRVLEQKETMNGLQDDECGAPCEDGHEGLCKYEV